MKTVCKRCNGAGFYFVNEWIGNLQGRRDCNCKLPTPTNSTDPETQAKIEREYNEHLNK